MPGAMFAPVETATVESDPAELGVELGVELAVELDVVVAGTSTADLNGDPPEHAASSTAATTPIASCFGVVRRMGPTLVVDPGFISRKRVQVAHSDSPISATYGPVSPKSV